MPLDLDLNQLGTIRRVYRKHRELLIGLLYCAVYLMWLLVFRLLVLTFITYFLRTSAAHFQEISDVYSSNEISLMGLSAVLFTLLLVALNPLTDITSEEIFTSERFEKRFFPGFIHGAVLASGVILAFLLSGRYGYLGFYIRFDEAPLALLSVLIRVFALGALAYCEEYLFRQNILGHFQRYARSLIPATDRRKMLPFTIDLTMALVVAALYCGIKAVQFDLGITHLLTLFLVSIALAIRCYTDQDFTRGAGFWAAILIVFHPLLSLPVLGNEFSGVVLIKFLGSSADLEAENATARFLTGGVGGPIASFAFQLVLLTDIVRSVLIYKKMILHPRLHQLR